MIDDGCGSVVATLCPLSIVTGLSPKLATMILNSLSDSIWAMPLQAAQSFVSYNLL